MHPMEQNEGDIGLISNNWIASFLAMTGTDSPSENDKNK